ncbi:DGQHR domain-containing protein [Candidatus Poribacteria bacterium]|nr:DGQHR domain-containing protein [Candidatus Poribacteria bacterium]
METLTLPYLTVEQAARKLILTKISAGVLTNISYVAVRRQSDESGAVQRVLNTGRIASIKKFTLEVRKYPGAIILNWVSKDNPIQRNNGRIAFRNVPRSAQIIDGQHRLAGIKEAIKERKEVASLELPVVIYENLDTTECADIFLSINAEQQKVQPSLVYDLYGVASKSLVDPAAGRARDIAMYLNEAPESPYNGGLKLPGAQRRRGGIALSTAVTAIKPLVEAKGDFEQVGVPELELQEKIVMNFFTAIREKYGNEIRYLRQLFRDRDGLIPDMYNMIES